MKFQNQGDNDESNVKVTGRDHAAPGKPITVKKTVDQTKAGAEAEVQIPLGQSPPIGTPVTITVTVAKVPGEKNDRQQHPDATPSLFTR